MAIIIRNNPPAVSTIRNTSRLPSPTLSMQDVIRLSLTMPVSAAENLSSMASIQIFRAGNAHSSVSNSTARTPALFLISTAEPITSSATLSLTLPIPGMSEMVFCSADILTDSITGVIIDCIMLIPVITAKKIFNM